MKRPRWILNEVAVSIHGMLIAEHGGHPGIRGRALLESVLTKPRQLFSYEPKSTIFELAAAYGFGLTRNHPFVDGNKRVALAVVAIFLELNGFSLDAPEPEAVIVIERLAAGTLSEPELSEWIRDSSVPND
uniref:Death on curing protein n=1 Tax=Candidatus Kentrum sp. MB TaxID=2138164 RepID=A0A450Y1A1_9GAMM|nr:MAG: death on curing protein [Candidatus Kentron sp. MB]VFK35296.1 MAG: death on curing protein [Candidatus Kentron sp. MB]VFK77223.1 MAG: death on curing protein [Candidatus Kentron sp. MB]